ncbi:MAG: ABC transporter permease [Bacteroidota bacterium]
MIFGKKKTERLLEAVGRQELDQSYWGIVKRRFRKNRMAKWSLRILLVIAFVGLFADFIANEKPLYCVIEGKTYFPVLKQYAVNLGLSTWESKFYQTPWHEQPYEQVVMPLIPYSHFTLDANNTNFVSPFADQDVTTNRYWHWMGTTLLGQDVAAGMIRGTRTALVVGILAMFIASMIGLFLGALAGYFGDDRFRISRGHLWMNVLGLFFAYFYGVQARIFELTAASAGGTFGVGFLKSIFIAFVIILLFNLAVKPLQRISFFKTKITIPFDLLVMRLIEIMNSIPALFLLLAVIAIIEQRSIVAVMVIIGFISWTGIARFIRAELLRVRSLEYIEAANAMGFGNWRIILRHALPNAIGPVLITVAFGIAAAILVEAFLSFLGVGPQNEMTWGMLLSAARMNPSAWWLAIFPGMAIFITVTVFNLIGDGLAEALDPRRKD